MNNRTLHNGRNEQPGRSVLDGDHRITPKALFSEAVQYHQNSDLEKAVECYKRAIEAAPDFAEAYYNLGVIRYSQRAWDISIQYFKKTLGLKPDSVDAAFNLAAAYKELGQYRQAALSYQQVLQQKPNLPDAFFNQGICYLKLGQIKSALGAIQQAVRLKADNPAYWFYLAEANLMAQSMADAVACYQKSIALKPDSDSTHYNLAVALRMLDKMDDAIVHLKQAVKINPNFSAAYALLYRLAQHTCDWPLASAVSSHLNLLTGMELSKGIKCSELPLTNIRRTSDVGVNMQVAQCWSRSITQQATAVAPKHTFQFKAPSSRRIRIGYLSNDFKDHAVAHQIRGMLEKHDRGKFEIFGYAINPDDGTRYRHLLSKACDRFREIHGLSDLAAAGQIHDDGIQILVDLAGHSRDNRLGIAALRPAPIQVSYLGFLGTTGADFIDYILADTIVVPDAHQPFFTEKIVYLPHCYQVNDDRLPIARKQYERNQFNLPNKGFIYCCFNQPYKIDEPLFATWLNILRQVDGSVLWLVKRSPTAQANLCRAAERANVDPERLVFTEFMPLEHNLARLRLADLVLDTCTHNGGATTSNALWAGVPVLTVLGHHWVSRMSSSALSAIGLPELITKDLKDYEKNAIDLALNPRKLQSLRHRLKTKLSTAPLFDTALFTSQIEKAFSNMWQRFLSGLKPVSFRIKP